MPSTDWGAPVSRPKVLVVGINYAPEPTGIAPYTTGLVAGLDRRGFEVRVLTARPHYPEWRVSPDWRQRSSGSSGKGVVVERVKHYVPSRPTGLRRAASEVSFGLRSVLARWGQPDLLICTSPALLSAAMAVMRSSTGRRQLASGLVVQDLYSTGAEQIGDYGPGIAESLARVERWALRNVDGVATIHEGFKRQIVLDMGIDRRKVTVIRNWTHIDSELTYSRRSMRAVMDWTTDDFVVLHTGAMGEKQDLMSVVRAARLAAVAPESVKFVLVGDGSQRASVEAAAEGMPSLDVVDPVSSRDYPSLLRAADLLLVNERPGVLATAVPSKLTSYFSTGLPILAATNEASITAEEIRASSAGVVTAPGNPQELLDEVNRLRRNPETRHVIGANGPEYCRRVLSQDAALDAYATWAAGLLEIGSSRAN